MTLGPVGKLANVVVPVADVSSALDFYVAGLGFELKFRDGDTWAAIDCGGVTLGLAGPAEHPPGGRPAISVKTADVELAVERAIAAGASLVLPPNQGAHELRALVESGSQLIYFYSRLPES